MAGAGSGFSFMAQIIPDYYELGRNSRYFSPEHCLNKASTPTSSGAIGVLLMRQFFHPGMGEHLEAGSLKVRRHGWQAQHIPQEAMAN